MAESEAAVCNLALLKIGANGSLIAQLTDASLEANVCALVYPQKRDELLRTYRWPWAQRRAFPAQLGGAAWAGNTVYAQDAYVSFAPSQSNVVNMPEVLTTFVYIAIVDIAGAPTDPTPDADPTRWRQISRPEWAYCFQKPADVLLIHDLYHGNRNRREDQHVSFEEGYEPAPGPGAILLTDAGFRWEVASAGPIPVSIEIEYTARVTDVQQFPPDFTEALAWLIAIELALSIRKDPGEAEKARAAYVVALGEATANASRGVRHDPPPLPSWITVRRGRRSGIR